MKIVMVSILLLSLQMAYAYNVGDSAKSTTLPSNQPVNPNQTIAFTYNFGAYTSMLCYYGSPNPVPNYSLQYTYQNHVYATPLPVVLTTTPQGPNTYLADINGTIRITNTSKTLIYVSCFFGF